MKRTNLTNRLTALILVLAMLASLLAGCTADEPTETAPEPIETAEQSLRWTNHISSDVMAQQTEGQGLQPLTTRAPGDIQTKEYTVMVYMVGSNLESEGGFATSDIYEMLDSGLDTSNCNLLVYTGGSKSWECGAPSECNTIWAMDAYGDLQAVASTQQPTNMGDPATFLDFLCYCYNYFPAWNYGLICWDHGGAPCTVTAATGCSATMDCPCRKCRQHWMPLPSRKVRNWISSASTPV